MRFYDAFRDAGFSNSAGRWIYVPNGSLPDGNGNLPENVLPPPPPDRPGAERPIVDHGDPGPPAMHEDGERHGGRAESEAPTFDPVVDPDEPRMQPSRRQRRAAKKQAAADPTQTSPSSHQDGAPDFPKEPGATRQPKGLFEQRGQPSGGKGKGPASDQPSTKNAAWRDSMLKDLHSIVSKDKEEKPWSFAKGPQPGIKYRGGTPPQPPQWTAARGDLQAFQRWERKLTVWRRQITPYLPPNESAMLLFVQLQGEAAEELEHCDISKIDSPSGVDYHLGDPAKLSDGQRRVPEAKVPGRL